MKNKRNALLCTLSLLVLLGSCAKPYYTEEINPGNIESKIEEKPLSTYQGEGFSFRYDSSKLEIEELDDDMGLMVSTTQIDSLGTIPRVDFIKMETAVIAATLTIEDFESFAEDVVKAYFPASVVDRLHISFSETALSLDGESEQKCSTVIAVDEYQTEDGAVYPAITANALFRGNWKTGVICVFVSQTSVDDIDSLLFSNVVNSLTFD